MAQSHNVIWKVVGGKDKGGIIVRAQKETSSAALPEKLSHGSSVRVLADDGCRVLYELIEGSGPHSGWVSTQIGSTTLIKQAESQDSDDDSTPELPINSDSEASTQDTPRQASGESMDDGKFGANAAMQEYICRFGKNFSRDLLSGKNESKMFVLNSGGVDVDEQNCKPNQQVHEKLAQEFHMDKGCKEKASMKNSRKYRSRPAFALLGDSDNNKATLCRQCHLPVGDVAYNGLNGVGIYHGECMAQHLLHNMRDEESERQQKLFDDKRARHEEYSIGWSPELIPGNAGPAEKLVCHVVPEGMCCLMMQEHSDGEHSVHVAATLEPSASVNLEYLSLALEVRRREGREPLFSLDPVNPADKKTMQGKRFEPEWLAGTSLGEVMFQADYHLKELSMGEYEQPVMGMKSCFDYAETECTNNAWNAREWFMVKDADIHVSVNHVLLPCVKMGVEAREQMITKNGMEDIAMTRKDHPLVKYAEAFTENFDLIAERKSAVFHLREAAKAVILAKFLLESNVNLEESWFNLAAITDRVCPVEVPQLWNERVYSQIEVKDGKIVDAEKGIDSSTRGIYGGVEFGLGQFELKAKKEQFVPRRGVGLSQAPTRGAAAAAVRGVTPLAGLRTAYTPMSKLMSLAPSPGPDAEVPTLAVKKPEGVDLNLDAFNLSQATRVQLEVPEASCSFDSCISMASVFWESLDKESGFEADDCNLLKAIFKPKLTDRRNEGDHFVPPDPSHYHVSKLRRLVKNEEFVMQQRKEHFCSQVFAPNDPGLIFPASWTPTFEMTHGQNGSQQSSLLQRRSDYEMATHIFEDVIKSAVPVFDKSVEDGTRFRIYQVGSVEVRTMQEFNSSEQIVAIFSLRCPTSATTQESKDWLVGETEHIAKVTEYVERAAEQPLAAGRVNPNYFVVLETEQGHAIATEMLEDGNMRWEENPDDLEDRISLAKVLHTTACQGKNNTIGNCKTLMMAEAAGTSSADKSKSKRYAQAAFFHAQGFSEAKNAVDAPEPMTSATIDQGISAVTNEVKPVCRKNKLNVSSLGLMSTNLMMPSNRS